MAIPSVDAEAVVEAHAVPKSLSHRSSREVHFILNGLSGNFQLFVQFPVLVNLLFADSHAHRGISLDCGDGLRLGIPLDLADTQGVEQLPQSEESGALLDEGRACNCCSVDVELDRSCGDCAA